MNRRTAIAATVAGATVLASLTPALAAPGKHKPATKTIKGTWSYTDTTPDPTVTADSNAAEHCHGKLPASPLDVNSHTFKAPAKGLLTVVGGNKLDWAMEVRDSKGNLVTGSDGSTPTSPEGVAGQPLRKGTYSVVYCNLEGEPTITASYRFTYH